MGIAIGIVVGRKHGGVFLVHSSRTMGVANIASQPFRFSAPINILIGFPGIGATSGETECLKPHRFECDITRKDQQIGPGNLVAVFLLDRPKQTTRFIKPNIIRPAVQRGKTLLSTTSPTAAVSGAVGARAVPSHADK